jgi:hypothetical protein
MIMVQIFYITDNNEHCFALKVNATNIAKLNQQVQKSIEITNNNPNVQSVELKDIKVYFAPRLSIIMEELQDEYDIEVDIDDYTTCAHVIYPSEEDVILEDFISDATTHVYPNGLLCITGFSDRDCKTSQSDYFGIHDFDKLKIDLTTSKEQ